MSIRTFFKQSSLLVSIVKKYRNFIQPIQSPPVALLPDPVPPLPDPVRVAPAAAPDPLAYARECFDIYEQYPPHVLYTFKEKHQTFKDALRAYSAVSVSDEPSGLHTDPNRVLNFFQLLEAANKLPSGDYIELGSHRGYSARVIHRFMDPTKNLYLLDTFEGFDARDIELEKRQYDTPWGVGSFAPTSVEKVGQYVGDGIAPKNLHIIKGWFPESFNGLENISWRFVHIDFDLYEPIRLALSRLWEPLLPGGIMLIHDYGSYGFPGARKAVDEFCQQIKILPIELSDRWSSAVIRKPL